MEQISGIKGVWQGMQNGKITGCLLVIEEVVV